LSNFVGPPAKPGGFILGLKNVRQIAIDEVCIGRPRKFITIVLDLETGQVLHIGRGKGAGALKEFWKRLKRSKAKIQAGKGLRTKTTLEK